MKRLAQSLPREVWPNLLATALSIAIALMVFYPSGRGNVANDGAAKAVLFQVLEKDFLQPKLASARQIHALNRTAAGAFGFVGYDEFKSAIRLPLGQGIGSITRYAGQIFRLLDCEFVLRERAAGGRCVFLSERFWELEFGRDAGVVGGELVVNGTAYRVAGVVRNNSALLSKTDIWLPAGRRDVNSESACLRVLANAAGRAGWSNAARILAKELAEDGAELVRGARFLSIEREMVIGGPEIVPSMIATSAEAGAHDPSS